MTKELTERDKNLLREYLDENFNIDEILYSTLNETEITKVINEIIKKVKQGFITTDEGDFVQLQ
ncbi:MAG TPA: hypothetical protein P5136_01060 [Methanofastidiosum sp.]|nr:hypothetical protein [Methanofastidiosum sp.]